MKKKYRLKSRLEFQAVYKQGRSAANSAAVVYVLPSKRGRTAPSRVGVAAGRRLGKATVRNRVKRRVKEAVRLLWPRVKPGFELIVIARHAAKDIEFIQLQARLQELFERLGVLESEGSTP